MTGKVQTVTRQDLANAVFREIGLSHAESKSLVDRVFELMADELVTGEPVKLAKFGTFSVKDKKERIGRNPKTGREIPIEARRILTFKASQQLIARVNNQGNRPKMG